VFALTNPYMLLRPDRAWAALSAQAAMAAGTADVPYTRQYSGTWPVVYQLEQLARWGLGPPLAALAAAALAWAAYRAVRQQSSAGEWVVLAWALPYAALTGALYAKFPRYLLPLTPALIALAALLLARLAARGPRARTAVGLLGGLGVVVAGLHALALVAMYAEPHPWYQASRWIYANVAPGATLASELWDDALPAALVIDGQPVDSARYGSVVLDLYQPDGPDKLARLAAGLAASDYVVLASRRLFGTLPRLAWSGDARYNATACYYQLLLDPAGPLGFRLVYSATRFPRLGPLVLVDRPRAPLVLPSPPGLALDIGPVDEIYNVYDHPQVLILQNVDRRSPAELVRLITADGCE
jgi:4-amino-4-deoxy-L-arabinose transferase-like glycosyltransferase